jgi:hypothetical protein
MREFSAVSLPEGPTISLDSFYQNALRQKRASDQALRAALLCRYFSGPGIAHHEGMLTQLKRRYNMSPLMLMLVLSLVPFPILAIAILADRLLKATQKTVS